MTASDDARALDMLALALGLGTRADGADRLERIANVIGKMTASDDARALDMLALGLGTKAEWDGADELEWIANVIGEVRPHPGDDSSYLDTFRKARGIDPLTDPVLRDYVSYDDDDDDDA